MPRLKRIAKAVVPQFAQGWAARTLANRRIRRVRPIFESASFEPSWLGRSELESLQGRYPQPPEYGYDPIAVDRRGRERASTLLKTLGGPEVNRYLELGCWDGMVSRHLRASGAETTAVDARSEGFDPRAREAGVRLLQMDATRLDFPDDSFDAAFSYDAFEHFGDPAAVFSEILRVVRPGGTIFLDFGPLYMAPYGLHAYRSVSVPYCQFLFPRELLEEFVRERKLAPIDFDQVNGWTVTAFRNLWSSHQERIATVRYREIPAAAHLDLVAKYPTCFKSKTTEFENLVFTQIEATFRKIR